MIFIALIESNVKFSVCNENLTLNQCKKFVNNLILHPDHSFIHIQSEFMKKLSNKLLENHPELAEMMQDLKAKKTALSEIKKQKSTLEEEVKTAKVELKKQLKTLSKVKKKPVAAKVETPAPVAKKKPSAARAKAPAARPGRKTTSAKVEA